MVSLVSASLSEKERRVIERLVSLLQEEFGADLRAVWLYGSRARGEPPGPESDVDLMVVSSRGGLDDHRQAIRLLWKAAEPDGANPMAFSIKLYEPEWVAGRREIRSFFMQEVDRDKIVLFGEP